MHAKLTIGVWVVLLGAAVAAEAKGADVATLITAAESPDLTERIEAIDQLGLVGAKHPEAIESLTRLLNDSTPAVRAHAAQSLGEIGPPALAAVPVLTQRVADTDAVVRRETIDALRKLRPGPAVMVPLMVKVLEGSDDAARIRAIATLADHGKESLPGLIKALGDPRAKYWVCLVITEIGPEAKTAVPALTPLLADEMPDVRREAILALAAIGEASAPAVPQLAAALDNKLNRIAATYALGSIGRVPGDIQAKIQANTKDDDPMLRTVSHWALAKLNPEDQNQVRQAVELLAEQLKNNDRRVRLAAARGLVDLQPAPSITQPILKRVMDEASPETLDAVLDALASQGERVLPRLIQALGKREARPRAAAILARVGPAAKPAVAALVEALEDDRAATRNEVLFALAAIGPEAREALPAMIRALNDEDPKVRFSACHALGKMGPAAMAAKAELQKRFASDDQFLALTSAWALAQIDPGCPETASKSVPVLIKALSQPAALARLHAAETLERLGPLAQPAVPALKAALEDDDEGVRAAASAALKRIGK
jgi:HEAT repeat protein